jgi:selenocysteine lyase/cysteine desulfurase
MPDMTTLTPGISRTLAREIGPGDKIVVTGMDHDANISPWLLVAGDLARRSTGPISTSRTMALIRRVCRI